MGQDTLWRGKQEYIQKKINDVRFKNKKAVYICLARDFFSEKGGIIIGDKLKGFSDRLESRDWLVRNIKGMGYKEASHFLRNIGFGKDLAILDVHILKNLKGCGVIDKIPRSLTKKEYLKTEEKMKKFCRKIRVPMAELDLLFWSKETGFIFK